MTHSEALNTVGTEDHCAGLGPSATRPGGTINAALRMIGHCSRHGGPLWGALAAQEYFPPGHPLLKALHTRLPDSIRLQLSQEQTRSSSEWATRARMSRPVTEAERYRLRDCPLLVSWSEKRRLRETLRNRRKKLNYPICPATSAAR